MIHSLWFRILMFLVILSLMSDYVLYLFFSWLILRPIYNIGSINIPNPVNLTRKGISHNYSKNKKQNKKLIELVKIYMSTYQNSYKYSFS